jgi:hypothetical protein
MRAYARDALGKANILIVGEVAASADWEARALGRMMSDQHNPDRHGPIPAGITKRLWQLLPTYANNSAFPLPGACPASMRAWGASARARSRARALAPHARMLAVALERQRIPHGHVALHVPRVAKMRCALHIALHSARCALHIALHIARCALHIALHSARCALHIALHSARCALHIALHSARCALHIALHSARCALHAVVCCVVAVLHAVRLCRTLCVACALALDQPIPGGNGV